MVPLNLYLIINVKDIVSFQGITVFNPDNSYLLFCSTEIRKLFFNKETTMKKISLQNHEH